MGPVERHPQPARRPAGRSPAARAGGSSLTRRVSLSHAQIVAARISTSHGELALNQSVLPGRRPRARPRKSVIRDPAARQGRCSRRTRSTGRGRRTRCRRAGSPPGSRPRAGRASRTARSPPPYSAVSSKRGKARVSVSRNPISASKRSFGSAGTRSRNGRRSARPATTPTSCQIRARSPRSCRSELPPLKISRSCSSVACAPDRPDRGHRPERRPRHVEPARVVVPAGAPAAGGGTGADAGRAQRAGAADERHRPLPRRRLGVPDVRTVARMVPRQRLLPARRPRPARTLRAAAVARHPGHVRRAVGVDRVDQQPQRHPDAGVPDDARRDRDRGARRARAAVGPGRAGLPGGRRRPARR